MNKIIKAKPKFGLTPQPVSRALSVENMASPFGACNFFDRCGEDDLLSLHYSGGLPLLDWMGFNVSNTYERVFEYLTYVRPARANGSPSAGHLADPCATPNGIEWGSTKLTINNFGRYGRRGPTRAMMKPELFCVSDPRRRLDGTAVTDEREWDARFAMDVILQDLSRDIITGNSATPGKMDGLEQWVKTGYDNPMLDSIVIDWNGNDLDGGAGITWNGSAIGTTLDIIDVLRSAVRRVLARIGWSPTMRMQNLQSGDIVLLMPTHMATCLLDFYTCWAVCPSTDNITVQLQSYEARQFRQSLNGGLYGVGQIQIDNITIPIMAYDWGLIKSATLSDMYVLIRNVGAVQTWFGEHLNADTAAAAFRTQGYFSTDGGRVLGVYVTENECYQLREWIHPRIYTRAPWLQVRIKDVRCSDIIDPLSPDPETSFFGMSSFEAAVCP